MGWWLIVHAITMVMTIPPWGLNWASVPTSRTILLQKVGVSVQVMGLVGMIANLVWLVVTVSSY